MIGEIRRRMGDLAGDVPPGWEWEYHSGHQHWEQQVVEGLAGGQPPPCPLPSPLCGLPTVSVLKYLTIIKLSQKTFCLSGFRWQMTGLLSGETTNDSPDRAGLPVPGSGECQGGGGPEPPSARSSCWDWCAGCGQRGVWSWCRGWGWCTPSSGPPHTSCPRSPPPRSACPRSRHSAATQHSSLDRSGQSGLQHSLLTVLDVAGVHSQSEAPVWRGTEDPVTLLLQELTRHRYIHPGPGPQDRACSKKYFLRREKFDNRGRSCHLTL